MLRLARLLYGIVSISAQRELAYRTDLFVRVGLTVLTAGGTLGMLAAVYARVGTLAGWSFGEAVVLLGMFVVVNGLLRAFVEPNLEWFGGKVRSGALDDILLKPAPSAFLASFTTCQVWVLVDVGIGVAICVSGLRSLHSHVTVTGVLSGLELLVVGSVVAWAVRLALASMAFWAGGLELTVLYFAPWQLGRFPVDVYGARTRWLLTYVVPVAFVSTFPARALARGAQLPLVVGGLAAAIAASAAALALWSLGLRRYTSATS